MGLSIRERFMRPLTFITAGVGTAIAIPAVTAMAVSGSLTAGLLVGGSAVIAGAVTPLVIPSKDENSPSSEIMEKKVVNSTPTELREQLKILAKRYDHYVAESGNYASTGVSEPDKVLPSLKNILTNGQKLFVRLEALGGSGNYDVAAVNYTDIFQKLNHALSPSYYGDLMKNPGLWDGTEELIASIEAAVLACDQQLVNQIRAVNENRRLDYSLSVSSLNALTDQNSNEKIWQD